MKVLFVYPSFQRHADVHPELRDWVPMEEYLGSPSQGIPCLTAVTPAGVELEFRDDRRCSAMTETDADLVALSFFTPQATRAFELAAYFKDMKKTVVAGGIFPSLMPDLVQPHVDSVAVGEGEYTWPRLLSDFARGALEPRYQASCPVGADVPGPDFSLLLGAEGPNYHPDDYPVQISRGCPLSCTACALPVSMGKNLRPFSLERIMAQLDRLDAAGKRACLTEDTSWLPGPSRTRMEELFDHLITSGRRSAVSYIGISMPQILTTPLRLLEKAKRAGVDMFYLVGGFDGITTKAFTGKNPVALEKAKAVIEKCKDVDIEPYTSFLIGGDQDDLRTVDRMLEFANETGIRKAEFAIFTPYPGTPSWYRLVEEGRILTTDWSRYNDANAVFQPAQMSPEELVESYLRLWREFYAPRRDALASLSVAERTIQF
jgi:radical SAM superfamily enzyme YgiQ (UPF0313 family)